MTLTSQRALFDIPKHICFLNAASYSPLPLATLKVAERAVARKGQPWLIDNDFAQFQYERTRKAAAAIINADPHDIALISSVGYGVATAAKIVSVPRGSRVLVLHDDHSSVVLEWITRATDGALPSKPCNRRTIMIGRARFLRLWRGRERHRSQSFRYHRCIGRMVWHSICPLLRARFARMGRYF